MLLFLSSFIAYAAARGSNGDDGHKYLNQLTLTTRSMFVAPELNSVRITNCQFVACWSQDDNGGAILFYNTAANSSLYCDNSVFHMCSSNRCGGAIYSMTSSLLILTTCVNSCSTGEEGEFCMAMLRDGHSTFNETSVVECTPYLHSGEAVISIVTTASVVSNLNSSSNAMAIGSAGVKLGSTYAFLQRSTFVNSSGDSVLTLNSRPNDHEISYLNVIGNTANYGVVFFNGEWTITSSIFADNGDAYFYHAPSETHLSFVKSVFDVELEKTERVDFVDCVFATETATYDHMHMNTALCYAAHSCTTVPPVSISPVEPTSVWQAANVIGALAGGISAAFVVGIATGVMFVCYSKKDQRDGATKMDMTGLLACDP